mmetsp:Transcript_28263/g.72108  ORF Transcript_28263/g.72108 Transcript_28263/m.72108 type:complete len:644 (-) Transcript_28263:183-2114(-)
MSAIKVVCVVTPSTRAYAMRSEETDLSIFFAFEPLHEGHPGGRRGQGEGGEGQINEMHEYAKRWAGNTSAFLVSTTHEMIQLPHFLKDMRVVDPLVFLPNAVALLSKASHQIDTPFIEASYVVRVGEKKEVTGGVHITARLSGSGLAEYCWCIDHLEEKLLVVNGARLARSRHALTDSLVFTPANTAATIIAPNLAERRWIDKVKRERAGGGGEADEFESAQKWATLSLSKRALPVFVGKMPGLLFDLAQYLLKRFVSDQAVRRVFVIGLKSPSLLRLPMILSEIARSDMKEEACRGNNPFLFDDALKRSLLVSLPSLSQLQSFKLADDIILMLDESVRFNLKQCREGLNGRPLHFATVGVSSYSRKIYNFISPSASFMSKNWVMCAPMLAELAVQCGAVQVVCDESVEEEVKRAIDRSKFGDGPAVHGVKVGGREIRLARTQVQQVRVELDESVADTVDMYHTSNDELLGLFFGHVDTKDERIRMVMPDGWNIVRKTQSAGKRREGEDLPPPPFSNRQISVRDVREWLKSEGKTPVLSVVDEKEECMNEGGVKKEEKCEAGSKKVEMGKRKRSLIESDENENEEDEERAVVIRTKDKSATITVKKGCVHIESDDDKLQWRMLTHFSSFAQSKESGQGRPKRK